MSNTLYWRTVYGILRFISPILQFIRDGCTKYALLRLQKEDD
jgi:hypothetical protein